MNRESRRDKENPRGIRLIVRAARNRLGNREIVAWSLREVDPVGGGVGEKAQKLGVQHIQCALCADWSIHLPPASSSSTTVASSAAAVLRTSSSSVTPLRCAVASASATLPVVTAGVASSSASSATTTTSTTSAAESALVSNALQPLRNLLVGLPEELEQVSHDVFVATVEERCGSTGVSGTTGTTDTMNVVVDVGGQIVVHDVGDVGNIETTGSNGGRNKDGGTAGPESLQRHLTLALGAVTVDGGGGKILGHEEVAKHVGHALGLDEDEGETTGGLGDEDVEQDRALVAVLDVLDLLGDVLRRGADTADGQEDVVLQEVLGEDLDVPGEGGTEHERLALASSWHVLALHDSPDLRLETHVKHTISLVEDKVLDVGETDATTLDEIDHTSGGGAEQVTPTLHLA